MKIRCDEEDRQGRAARRVRARGRYNKKRKWQYARRKVASGRENRVGVENKVASNMCEWCEVKVGSRRWDVQESESWAELSDVRNKVLSLKRGTSIDRRC